MHVELSNGESAEVRDPASLTRGEMKRLNHSIREAGTADTGDEPEGLIFDALLAHLVTSWTLNLPLPSVDPSVPDQLLLSDFRILNDATIEVLNQLKTATDFSESTDPESPTKPSNASASRKRATRSSKAKSSPSNSTTGASSH